MNLTEALVCTQRVIFSRSLTLRLHSEVQLLTCEAYKGMCAGSRVLESDRYGEKVLSLNNGCYLKLFRRKRLLSSAAWYPYAQRFADNAVALAERGIPCPDVIDVFRIPHITRDAVYYRPLPGQTLRQLLKAGNATDSLREKLFSFVEELHQLGVYFRSLHLGNIVLTTDEKFGLIDIADMRISRYPLNRFERQRNLRHLCRNAEDTDWLHGTRQGE